MRKSIFRLQIAWIVLLMLFTFNIGIQAKKGIVQRGMTKDQVVQILGKPDATSFNSYGDFWTYIERSILNPDKKIIYISFNRDEKVTTYQERFVHPSDGEGGVICPVAPPRLSGYYPGSNEEYNIASLSDKDYNFLYDKIKTANFDDDRYTLLEVASLGCWYTCAQCARIMQIFSFDESKLKALHIMARHIIDLQNAVYITKELNFSDSKEKALQMLQ